MFTRIKTQFSHQARNKGIQLTITAPNETIQTDRDALTRILENLISNAIKFSPAGTDILIEASLTPTHTTIVIADQGPGIPEEELPLLFQKFQKLSNKPTGVEGSTGLGLSIVKELVNLLKGSITVTSYVNQGTTFTIRIPNTE